MKRTARGHYALELVRCGKERCRCMQSSHRHGPYWYLYRHSGDGKYAKTYIGRELPGGASETD